MRYRPFGISGKAVSAISVLMRESSALPTPLAWRTFIFSAMESGVNCFEMVAGSEAMCAGMRGALEAVERRLLFLTWRMRGEAGRPLTADHISRSVREGLHRVHCAYFDVLMLDEQAFATLTDDAHQLLDDLRAGGLALQIGVAGGGPVIDSAIADPTFEVAASPFNLTSGWDVRRRMKEAVAANMALVGYDVFPQALLKPAAVQPQKTGLFRRHVEPLAGAGTYAFLHETPGWAASELCLAYALTEPAFATVQVEVTRAEILERMCAVADRDLPTGVAAQIEMARFSPQANALEQKRA
ncbi:MAG: aldo/keto reductase [Phenylobacterium sp.]|uniref:aldo/keto reductase n=1 Tax=Phenylobacterium sp. TaxID=1871053 RepID=UPI00391B5C15